MTTHTASPTKLRDGSWGARTSADIAVGDTITITARSGKSWDAVVERIVWTGANRYGKGDVAIVAIRSLDQDRPRRSRNGCDCTDDCCRPRCQCHANCNCRGGNIYDC